MTKEDIYKMVRESNLGFLLGDNWMMHHEFEYFAALVASAEREACAKEAENTFYSVQAAENIRARGQA